MKKISLCVILLGSIIITSCGTSASYTSGTSILDGIYYNPDYSAIKASTAAEEAYIAELTSETKASRIYSAKADTIVLGESRQIDIPLEPEKSYVVLLEGETYEERFNKFNDDQEPSFTINFEYNFGYGYNWGWNPYHRWYAPWYHSWYDPWYDPWYNPWYSPWYGPGYAWGWYDPWYYSWYDPWYSPWYNPWYNPWYGPGYPPVHPGFGPGPGGPHHHKDIIYGRRDLNRDGVSHPSGIKSQRERDNARNQRLAEAARQGDNAIRPDGLGGVNQVRGREIKRTNPVTASERSSVNASQGSATQRTGIRNSQDTGTNTKYRQSSGSSSRKSATTTATSSSNSRNTTGYYNPSQHNTNRSSYSQSRNSSYSGSSGSSYRSSGSTSGGGGQRTGGRR